MLSIADLFQNEDERWLRASGNGALGGDRLINDYEEVINGKRTKMQDIWSDITPNSYTLMAVQEAGNGTLMPYVVSRNRRKEPG